VPPACCPGRSIPKHFVIPRERRGQDLFQPARRPPCFHCPLTSSCSLRRSSPSVTWTLFAACATPFETSCTPWSTGAPFVVVRTPSPSGTPGRPSRLLPLPRRHHNVLQKLPTRIESWSVPSGATIEVTGRGLHIFTGPSERGEFTSNLFVSGLSAPLYYFEITVLPNVGLEIPRIGLSLGAKLPKGEEPTEGVTAETLQLVSGSGGFTKSHIFRTTSPPHFFATIQNGQACWKPGDVVGLGMFTRTDWRGFESVGFHTHNGRFVETFSPPGCDTKKAPLYPTVEIGAGQRIAINLGAAPFAFDLTTLRGPGEDEPGYQWEFSEPPRN